MECPTLEHEVAFALAHLERVAFFVETFQKRVCLDWEFRMAAGYVISKHWEARSRES